MRSAPLAGLVAAALLAGCSGPPAATEVESPAVAVEQNPAQPQVPPDALANDAATRPAGFLAACDWTRVALPGHRAMIDVDARTLPEGIGDRSGDTAQLVALLERPAQPPGDIRGRWRVRSLQYDGRNTYVYPFFDARIDGDDCGARFAKTSGSQRRTGVLYPVEGDPDRLAFLGAATVNDDPPRNYDPARPQDTQFPGEANSAGWLVRIGPDELLMVLDAVPGRLEAYHLRR